MMSKFNLRAPLRLLRRFQSSEKIECNIINRADLDSALKKLYAQHANIPIVIGEELIYSGDEQNRQMPHNHRRLAAKYYYATKSHIQFAIEKAVKIQEDWASTDVQYRANCFREAARTLASTETTTELMSAIMLGQAKTRLEAERDIYRLIRMLTSTADDLIALSQLKLKSESDSHIANYVLRPLDGFVACTGPISMTWKAAYLALGPLIMGNAVLWRPSKICAHSTYIIFTAMMKAGIPQGALQFLPSNYGLFFNTVIKSPFLACLNYSGRLNTLQAVWHDIAVRLVNYKCFPRLVGECNSKGFHFVHESADLARVVELTITAAFRYSGQRPDCCARLYVPDSVWPELSCQLQTRVASLIIGDPTDEDCFASAIVHSQIYDEIVEYLNYADCTEGNEIIVGGNFNKSHGYFVEPTIIVCSDPCDRLMIDDIMGPVLSVYVYEKDKLDKVIETVRTSQKFGGCGSIFAKDETILTQLLPKLRMTASNMYINNQCTGSNMSHLPLSGNRLSGTNDKNGAAYYLLRFAAPQMVEEMVGDTVDE